MANKVLSFRVQEKLIAAVELAAEMNGIDRNEELRMALVLRYEPYLRMLEARAKSKVSHHESQAISIQPMTAIEAS